MDQKKKLFILLLFLLTIGLTGNVCADTYTVTNTWAGGTGSLYRAIEDVNLHAGTDTIVFAIAGTFNITFPFELTDVNGGTLIDGTSAPGYSGTPIVIINGGRLQITSANNEVRGLQFHSATNSGIYILGSSASGNIIVSNYIGTDGTVAYSCGDGIYINNSPNNRIGTDGDGINDTNECNVISGNNTYGISIIGSSANDNIIAGNYIGTNAAGASALGNGYGIFISIGSNNRIGTDGNGSGDLAERNIISGNINHGIILGTSSNTIIAGNYIGVDVTGENAIGNGDIGISFGGSDGRIGTDGNGIADEFEGNVISSNLWGMQVYGNGNSIAGNFIGTDATGTYALGNTVRGVYIGGGVGHRLGTDGNGISDALERNIISGNNSVGVEVFGSSTTGTIVAGNYIGTDITGTVSLGNGSVGVIVTIAVNTLVGTDGDGISDDNERNIISGNLDQGISVSQAPGTIITGNYIGTDETGTLALGNKNGVSLHGSSSIRLGTNGDDVNDVTERNIISGNSNTSNIGYGVSISGSGHIVAGNYIGTDASGIAPLGNSHDGIYINNSSNNTIEDNAIAFNESDGIVVYNNSGSVNNKISQNSIFSNGGIGIDLSNTYPRNGVTQNDAGDGDTGANNLQNFPVLTAVSSDLVNTTIEGTLNSTPNTIFTLEFFSNSVADTSGYGEGENFLGSTIVTTDGSGDTNFTATFPTVVPDDEFFTATATDPDGNTSEFSSIYKREFCSIVSVNNEWNMISVPLLADDMALNNLFPTATSSAYGFNGSYVTEDTLATGVAYWLKFDGNEQIQICGSKLGDTVQVGEGWNMFGIYEEDILISQITTTPPGIIATYFFGFRDGYYIADTLKSGQGHWVRVTDDGSLSLNSGGLLKDGEQEQLAKIDQNWGKIKITDNNGIGITLYATEKEIESNLYELPPMPPSGVFDARYSSGKLVEALSSEKIILISSDKYPITIRAEGIRITVRDRINRKILNEELNSGKELRITNSKITSIEVTGTISGGLPVNYELYQNYPNPFNPTTTIKFAVPKESNVNLNIYNVLGELVSTLVNEQMKPGYYEYGLDATNLASGVYLYKLQAGSFVETKKMLLIK